MMVWLKNPISTHRTREAEGGSTGHDPLAVGSACPSSLGLRAQHRNTLAQVFFSPGWQILHTIQWCLVIALCGHAAPLPQTHFWPLY